MTIKSIFDLVQSDGLSWVLVIVVVSSLIEISPLKINPLGDFLSWFGRNFNKSINEKITVVETKLDEHIKESEDEKVEKIRDEIIGLGTQLYRKEDVTMEQLKRGIVQCDWYDKYIENNNIENGVAETSMDLIRQTYKQHMFNGMGGD